MLLQLSTALLVSLALIFSVAWVTMLERKLLSYQQARVGPNKPGPLGLVTPLSDAAKLLTKSWTGGSFYNNFIFKVSPIVFFLVYLLMMVFYVQGFSNHFLKFGGWLFLFLAGFSVYGVLLTGWASNSPYALLGSLRGGAQALSYEVGLFIFFVLILFIYSEGQSYLMVPALFPSVPILVVVFFMVLLADLGRAPFDFVEGESELVSGFNVEYSATPFAMIFLGEYLGILFFSWVFSNLLVGAGVLTPVIVGLFISVRGAYPRSRYDTLMGFSWATILPLMISGLALIFL